MSESTKGVKGSAVDDRPDNETLHGDSARLVPRDRRDFPRCHLVGCLGVGSEDFGAVVPSEAPERREGFAEGDPSRRIGRDLPSQLAQQRIDVQACVNNVGRRSAPRVTGVERVLGDAKHLVEGKRVIVHRRDQTPDRSNVQIRDLSEGANKSEAMQVPRVVGGLVRGHRCATR